MDRFTYALDIGVAAALAGFMIVYNIHKGKEIDDMRVGDILDGRRYFFIANIVTVLYAVICVVGLSVSVFSYPPALWITMILLGAFMIVDLVRMLIRVHSLRQRAQRENSYSAAVVASEIRKAGLWMMLYTMLQILNLFYFT